MVDFTDLKVYKSASGGLGGAIDTAAQVILSTSNNFFPTIPRADMVTGKSYYGCAYLKNTHATESMDDFKIWESGGTPSPYTLLRWGFDPLINTVLFDGVDDLIACGDQATLWSQSLTKFSFSVWIFPTAGWDTNDRTLVTHGSKQPLRDSDALLIQPQQIKLDLLLKMPLELHLQHLLLL